jgi:hypothetical protein
MHDGRAMVRSPENSPARAAKPASKRPWTTWPSAFSAETQQPVGPRTAAKDINDHTYNLTRVEDELRAWRLIGLDDAGTDSRDGQLNFTLFRETLSTRLGRSGVGLDVK